MRTATSLDYNLFFEEKKILTEVGRVNYVSKGEGDPIIFLHNGGGFWQSFTYQIEFFSQTHRAIAMDFLGFGESDETPENLSLDLYYRQLRAFIQELGLREVILVGNCIGASVALFYQQQHPENVKKTIAMNICPGRRIYGNEGRQKFMKIASRQLLRKIIMDPLFRFIFAHTPFKNQFPRVLFGDTRAAGSPLYRKCEEKMKDAKQRRSRLNLLYSVESYTLADFWEPAKAGAPLLVIWGEKNQVCDLEKEGYYHRDLLGSCTFIELAGAGHLLMYEYPEAVNELMKQFVESGED